MNNETIKNTKQFMNNLLVGNTFDDLYLSEITIKTYSTFVINGITNTNYYSKEELESERISEYQKWSTFKSLCFQIIKGNKAPELIKIIFVVPKESYKSIFPDITNSELDNISTLYLNIKFEHNTLVVTNGLSYKTFTLDKDIDKQWDTYFSKLLAL